MKRNLLENLITTNAALKNAYFWQGGDASSRRYTEQKYSVPKITIEHNNDIYEAEIIVSCSRANVYVTRNFTKNGKQTNITPFKNLYAKLS